MRTSFLCALLFGVGGLLRLAGAEGDVGTSLVESITKESIRRNRDGSAVTWFHPRACRIPALGDRPARILMTCQEIGGSDYFGTVHWTESVDQGRAWRAFEPIAAFGRQPVDVEPVGLEAGVCDVVPQYHPPTQTVLAMGHVVFYRGPRFSANDQLARYPVYSVWSADGQWSERKVLAWDDPRGSFIYTNNCGQRWVLPDGDILLAFSFGAESAHRSIAGVRCGFDGERLAVKAVGPPLELRAGRGLLEPSVTRFGGKFFLTLRAEDGQGYHSVSEDGLHWGRMEPWCWDDGTLVSMSSTQQHWLAHSERLYLVYTRKDTANSGVIRWRAPLWMAEVDPVTGRLNRASERIVLPMVGDGVNAPETVALMGNFHVTHVTEQESWVTVGEWIPALAARGDLLLSRIRWREPNRLVSVP